MNRPDIQVGFIYFDRQEKVWRTGTKSGVLRDFKTLDGEAGILPHMERKLGK
jgi:hypothetical protein